MPSPSSVSTTAAGSPACEQVTCKTLLHAYPDQSSASTAWAHGSCAGSLENVKTYWKARTGNDSQFNYIKPDDKDFKVSWEVTKDGEGYCRAAGTITFDRVRKGFFNDHGNLPVDYRGTGTKGVEAPPLGSRKIFATTSDCTWNDSVNCGSG